MTHKHKHTRKGSVSISPPFTHKQLPKLQQQQQQQQQQPLQLQHPSNMPSPIPISITSTTPNSRWPSPPPQPSNHFYSPLKLPQKKSIPPPLDLTRSIQSPSTSSHFHPDPHRPGTPLSADAYSPEPTPLRAHLSPSIPHLPLQPLDEDLAIADEERQAAEWMGACPSNTALWIDNSISQDPVHQILSPIPLIPNTNDTEEDDSGLSIMEKIFLFAKSENAQHRVIVSQRLPELLQEVDITEAVEYVLPLLIGLAQDDQMIREALGPSICNIMWYYFSRCPLIEMEDPSNVCQSESSPSLKSSTDGCSPKDLDWQPDEPRKRPLISLHSFTALLVTLLTDTDRSIGLLARYGLLAFLCRLVDCPLPDWSEDLRLWSGEPFLPIDYHGPNREDQYEPYSFSESIRKTIAAELVSSVIDDLCAPPTPSASSPYPAPDQNESCESDDWDTVPLGGGDESEHRQTVYESGPSSDLLLAHMAPGNHIFNSQISPSQYSTENLLKPPDPLDHLHRQQIGLILIECIAQARCLDPNLMYRKLLPKLIDEIFYDQTCRSLQQQAASTLTTLMISLSAPLVTPPYDSYQRSVEISQDSENVLIDSYRSFASDLDPEVRKQICLGLPALLKLVQPHRRTQLALELMDLFSRDDHREVRIVGCQILGELIHVFYLENLVVPNQLVDYFLSGFENNDNHHYQQQQEHQRQRQPQQQQAIEEESIQSNFFTSRYFDELTPSPFDQFTDHLPHTSSSFGTSGLSAEHTERAMCCSYNFPAVLLTLGLGRWQELRTVFLKLTTDVSYPPKIRRSLARSMHELIKLIRAPIKSPMADTMDDAQIDQLRSLATEDWLRVLKFFLFEDQELSNTQAVLDTLDISLSNIDVLLLQDDQLIIEIIDRLSEYFVHTHPTQNLDDHNNHSHLTNGPLDRKIDWTIRERVVLLLPKMFENLKIQIKNKKTSSVSVDFALERVLEGCFETLLFEGLNDPAAAVREAALEFVPVFFSNSDGGSMNDRRGSQLRLIGALKSLSFDSNYRVRMMYPRAMLTLIKAKLISIELLESQILTSHFVQIAEDRVGGVRIGLSRLIHELCHSTFYYGRSDQQQNQSASFPIVIKKIIRKLANDSESVVCSYLENLRFDHDIHPVYGALEEQNVERGGDDGRRQSSSKVDEDEASSHSTHECQSGLGRQTPRCSISSSSSRMLECLEDHDSDDLSGSGIKVDHDCRLSDDDAIQIGDDVHFLQSSSDEDDVNLQNHQNRSFSRRSTESFNKGKARDFARCESSPNLSISSFDGDDKVPRDLHHLHHHDHLFDYSSPVPFVKLSSKTGLSSCSSSEQEEEDEEDEDEEEEDRLVGSLSAFKLGNKFITSPIPGPSSPFIPVTIDPVRRPDLYCPQHDGTVRATTVETEPELVQISKLGARMFIGPSSSSSHDASSSGSGARIDSIRRSISEPATYATVAATTSCRITSPLASCSSSTTSTEYSTYIPSGSASREEGAGAGSSTTTTTTTTRAQARRRTKTCAPSETLEAGRRRRNSTGGRPVEARPSSPLPAPARTDYRASAAAPRSPGFHLPQRPPPQQQSCLPATPLHESLWMRETDGGFVEVGEY